MDEHWTKDGIHIGFSAKTYIQNVIPKFEELFQRAFKKVKTPMEAKYHPEVDDSPLLDADMSSKYRSVIGSLNWIITLGRFDVQYATNSLSRFSMAPRVGHLDAILRVMVYLKCFPHGCILIDTSVPPLRHDPCKEVNWQEQYPDAEEELPPTMLEPKGKVVRITVYVHADHTHDLVT